MKNELEFELKSMFSSGETYKGSVKFIEGDIPEVSIYLNGFNNNNYLVCLEAQDNPIIRVSDDIKQDATFDLNKVVDSYINNPEYLKKLTIDEIIEMLKSSYLEEKERIFICDELSKKYKKQSSLVP